MTSSVLFDLVKTLYVEYSIHAESFNILVAIKKDDVVTPLYYSSNTTPRIPCRTLDSYLGTGKMIIVGMSTYKDILNVFEHPLSDLAIVICHKKYEDDLEKIIADTGF